MGHRTPNFAGEFCPDFEGIGQLLTSRKHLEHALHSIAEDILARAVDETPKGRPRTDDESPIKISESFKIDSYKRVDSGNPDKRRLVFFVFNDHPNYRYIEFETPRGNFKNQPPFAPLRKAVGNFK